MEVTRLNKKEYLKTAEKYKNEGYTVIPSDDPFKRELGVEILELGLRFYTKIESSNGRRK